MVLHTSVRSCREGGDHFQFSSDLEGLSLSPGLKSGSPSTQQVEIIVTEQNNSDPCRERAGGAHAPALQCQFPTKKIDLEPSGIICKHLDT